MKLFYDHIIIIDEILQEVEILEIESSDKKLLRELIDDMVTHAVMTHILDLLPHEHHEEFLERFHTAPHDLYLMQYLEKKTNKNMHAEITGVGNRLKKEIRKEFKKHTKK